MDKDTSQTGTPETGLPKTSAFSVETSKPTSSEAPASSALVASSPTAVAEQNDRTGIFGQLVKDDSDIAGLVAYSIYKQNKLDWLRAFETSKGRGPNDAELGAYILGEGTPRRLSTYRHLAESTLAGNGPDSSGSASGGVRRLGTPDVKSLTTGLMVTYGLIAVMFLVILWFASHLTR